MLAAGGSFLPVPGSSCRCAHGRTDGRAVQEAGGVGGELVAAGDRAEPPHHAVQLQVRGVVLLHAHAADRVGRHRGQDPEGPVLQPQDPVGDLLQAGVVADDHHAAAVLGGELAQQPGDLAAAGDVDDIDQDRPGGKPQHRAVHQQQVGLAAARRAHHQDHLAGDQVEVDVADGRDRQRAFPVGLGEPADADRLGAGGHDGLLNALAGSTLRTRRNGMTAPAAPTIRPPTPVRSTLAGVTVSWMVGAAAPSVTPTRTASTVASARARTTCQTACAATMPASWAGRPPSALTTPYSRSLARVTVNRVSAITASAIASPMPVMMRIRSVVMSLVMRASWWENSARVCTVLPGGMPSRRARSSPRAVPGEAPTSR